MPSPNHALRLLPALTACVWMTFLTGPGALEAQTIYVRIMVDEEQPTTPRAWQQRLSGRLQKASDIVSKYCSLRFAASCYGSWDSEDDVRDISQSLREFEQEARPSPAHIAIGFTSQYHFQRGRHALGGIRGPLHSHILIREGASSVHETERVEVLLHELGHFLGAAHSVSPGSVMRPVMGDGLARSKNFQIHFDPDNARVIRLVAAEIRDLRVRRFEHLSLETKRRLRVHYAHLLAQAPTDPTARKYIELIDRSLPKTTPRPTRSGSGGTAAPAVRRP